METLGEDKMKKKKTVIRVVKKIVKKKVIKKVPKPKPESKTESFLGVSSSNCDSFGSNDTSGVMGVEKAVENDVLSDSGRVEVGSVKGEEEKGVCLVENGYSCDPDRVERKIEKLDEKLSEFENVKEEKGVCLVENGDRIDNDGMEIEKLDVVAEKLNEFKNVKEEEEKGVRLVHNDGLCDLDQTDNDGMVIEKLDAVDEKLSEFENVKDVAVSDKGNEARLCEKNGLSMDESEINGLVTSYLVSDKKGVELQDGDANQIITKDVEVSDKEIDAHLVELQDGDTNQIITKDVEVSDKEIDVHLVERNDFNRGESEINGLVTLGDQNGIESKVTDQNESELQMSDQNRVGDNDTMDVKGHEGEDGVKEQVVDTGSDSSKLQQGLSESRVLSGQMVASWWHMKQRRKIFVHGLDKETKEDDIRKVFEKIGEVVEVKLITNFNSGKSRGFGFVRYASADIAELALTKFRHVEIRGSTWHTAPVEASDTIVLNNIDTQWNNENVISLLQKVGITEIDEVSVVPDPENSELNRGFAFIEFETKRDAQMAYRKLKIKNVFGEYSKIKVTWAESLADPVEEEMHNVKSVFAEYIPSSWDEKEVKDHFKVFGEIESIALAKNLHSAKRNDFAFINYKTCQAALSCIEALNNKRSTSENGPKAHPKVSLAKSIPKGKPVKIKSESAVTKASNVKQLSNQSRPSRIRYQNASQSRPFHSPYQNASQSRPSRSPYQNASQSRPSHSPYQNASQSRPSHSPYQNASQSRPSHSRYQNTDQLRPSQGISGVYQPQKAIRSEVPSIVRHEASRKDEGSSTTNELVQLLREQASWKLGGPSSTAGMSTSHPQFQYGGKQLQLPTDLTQGRNAVYLDPRSYHQTHHQMPNLTQPRPIVASPHYDQQRAHYTHGYTVVEPNPRHIQKRDQASYPGNGRSFYR